MTASAFLLAVSFLPFFEAKNASLQQFWGGEASLSPAVRPELTERVKCPICAGKGIILTEEKTPKKNPRRLGENIRKRVPCEACGGKKWVEAYVQGLTFSVARDREQFAAAHLAQGDVPVGQAFVPQEAYARIKNDRKILKLIENAYGKPCSTCFWTGIESCKKCDGTGVVPGEEEDEAPILCPSCNGRRAKPCKKCNGLGSKQKGR